MTEKEYLNILNQIALNYDAEYVNECHDDFCISMRKNIKQLENLIKEHFDNPPLKFEELKEEIWIWDNKEKTYIKSCNNYDTKEHGKGIRVQIGFDLVRINYEENRFYRKQVEDE